MTEIRDETGAQRMVGYVMDVGGAEAPGDGRARVWLDVDARHLNRQGILHGGLSSMLLDNAMGATASLSVDPSGMAPFSTVSLTVNFLAPGREGRVTALGRVTGGGQRTLFLEGRLTQHDGTVIATATGVFRRAPGQGRAA